MTKIHELTDTDYTSRIKDRYNSDAWIGNLNNFNYDMMRMTKTFQILTGDNFSQTQFTAPIIYLNFSDETDLRHYATLDMSST